MAQPTAGEQWVSVSGGVGTTVVSDKNVVLKRIIVPGTYVGTINFHDAVSAVGTTATSQILSLGLPTTTIPFQLELNAQCKKGLVYQATGTPVLTFTWD
jgi:hypothetical protein